MTKEIKVKQIWVQKLLKVTCETGENQLKQNLQVVKQTKENIKTDNKLLIC